MWVTENSWTERLASPPVIKSDLFVQRGGIFWEGVHQEVHTLLFRFLSLLDEDIPTTTHSPNGEFRHPRLPEF